jgi:hypothetical protein
MALNTVPLWIRSQDITLIQIQQQAVSAAGALSNTGTALGLEFLAQMIGYEVRFNAEEVSAVTSQIENDVVFQFGWEFRVRELMQRTASDLTNKHGPQLAQLTENALSITGGYMRVKFTRALLSWECYCAMRSYSEIFDQEPFTGEALFRSIDNGVLPTYAP